MITVRTFKAIPDEGGRMMRLPGLVLMVLMMVPRAQGPVQGAQDSDGIERFLGAEAAVVLRIELEPLNPARDLPKLLGSIVSEKEVAAAISTTSEVLKRLRDGGARVVYVVGDLASLPGMPTCVVRLKPGADARGVEEAMGLIFPRGVPEFAEMRSVKEGDFLLLGSAEAVTRLREPAAARQDQLEALQGVGGAPIRLILAPSETQRRVMEETAGDFPAELGGGPVTPLTRGMRWMGLSLRFQPELEMRMVVEARDGEAAKELQGLWRKFRDSMVKSMKEETGHGQADAVGGLEARLRDAIQQFATMDMEVQGTRLELQNAQGLMQSVAAPAVIGAREASSRVQCVNNLKQIGLALHNYHHVNKKFPGAYSADGSGKPLLSWRVHVLPYLGEEALYKEFHLSEPWDSPHNRELISRMPLTYQCPGSLSSAKEGKTVYLAPRGPRTILSGGEGTSLLTIRDGTSNTAMVIEAGDENAVIWTKPDDWEAGEEGDPRFPASGHAGGSNMLFGDGAVRFIKRTIDPKVLRALLTKDGGEVISADQF
jgi:prepilin-type processing-associated H-X9-DG protein